MKNTKLQGNKPYIYLWQAVICNVDMTDIYIHVVYMYTIISLLSYKDMVLFVIL